MQNDSRQFDDDDDDACCMGAREGASMEQHSTAGRLSRVQQKAPKYYQKVHYNASDLGDSIECYVTKVKKS